MRKIKAGDRIEHCVYIGEVLQYNPGDGFYYDVVAVNKPEGEVCKDCVFWGYDCRVWLNTHYISLCCTDVDPLVPNRFCKFVRVDSVLEEL